VSIYGSNLAGQIIYDVDEDRVVFTEGTLTPAFKSFKKKVISLFQYLLSSVSAEVLHDYAGLTYLLSQVNGLTNPFSHPVNNGDSVRFGLFRGTLCYDDISGEEPELIKRINRTEREYLFCDNAETFIIAKSDWPHIDELTELVDTYPEDAVDN